MLDDVRYPPRKYLDICYAETEICVNNPCLTLVTELQCGAGSPWPDLKVDVDGAGVVVDDDLNSGGPSLIV